MASLYSFGITFLAKYLHLRRMIHVWFDQYAFACLLCCVRGTQPISENNQRNVPSLFYSVLNSQSQIASRCHSPIQIVQAETYPDDCLLSCHFQWFRLVTFNIVRSNQMACFILCRGLRSNSTQNELGKEHVSAFLWCFRVHTAWDPSWLSVNKNEVIHYNWPGVWYLENYWEIFYENCGHCRLILYVYSVKTWAQYLISLMIFMPPAWKVRRGHLVFGSSVRPSVCPSVRPSVRLSVRNSVPLTFKVQYFKFGWSYSNQTWTESPSMDCSHFTDITCPWGWGRVKIWDLEILPYFDFVAAGGIRVSQTHV